VTTACKCDGSTYKGTYIKNNDGLFRAAWLKKLAEWRAAAGKANHILIIGGGVTGVEVVGELATGIYLCMQCMCVFVCERVCTHFQSTPHARLL
jgi:hypothetical protein